MAVKSPQKVLNFGYRKASETNEKISKFYIEYKILVYYFNKIYHTTGYKFTRSKNLGDNCTLKKSDSQTLSI